MTTSHIEILGVRVDDVSMAQTVDQIVAWARTSDLHHVVTVNPEFVMVAQSDPLFREVLRNADLAVADGVGLQLAARWTGQHLLNRVPGVELCEQLAARSGTDQISLFLLGAAPGVAKAAAGVLRERHAHVQIVGTFAGSPRVGDEPIIHEYIRAARPDVLLVAYGAPQQDVWIARNQAVLGVPVALGVGGAFDFLAGRVPRAPRWMRRTGLEWLFRLIQQPWRIKRIWTAVVRFPLAVWQEQASKRARKIKDKYL